MAAKVKIKSGKSRDLEGEFLRAWTSRHGTSHSPVTQLHFAKRVGRQWRFDMCWPEVRLAVEIDGGTFVGGGHNRGAYLHETSAKTNAAILMGWRVLRFTTKDFDSADSIARMIEIVSLAFRGKVVTDQHAALFPTPKQKKKSKKPSDPLPGYGVNLSALGIKPGKIRKR